MRLLHPAQPWHSCASQVQIGGRWGTVCAKPGAFSKANAAVVCRSMGLAGGQVQAFPKGSLPILISDVRCSGAEKLLSACAFSVATAKCNHGMDVGVVCKGELAQCTACTCQ